MGSRIALFLMAFFVAAACASCAARQADPVEPDVPNVTETPEVQDADAASDAEAFTGTVSTVLGDVQVAHEVPAGWSVDLSHADEGQIRMSAPDTDAAFGLFVTRRRDGITARQVMTVLLAHWVDLAARDPRVQIEPPINEVVQGVDIWALICHTNAGDTPGTVAHIFFISNDPDFMMAGIGAWPTGNDEAYLEMLGRIAGGAVVRQSGGTDVQPASI